MSDEETTEEQQEQRLAARDKIAEAIGEYADSFDGSSGALLTGYVIAAEVTGIDTGVWFLWFTGNGSERRGEDLGGLASHRAEGLMHRCIREIENGNASST